MKKKKKKKNEKKRKKAARSSRGEAGGHAEEQDLARPSTRKWSRTPLGNFKIPSRWLANEAARTMPHCTRTSSATNINKFDLQNSAS
jgi:hypothetical protein